MKHFILGFFFLMAVVPHAQNLLQFKAPKEYVYFSEQLNDTVKFYVLEHKEHEHGPNLKLPVVYVFDRQNEFNSNQILNSIDYLSGMGGMPASLVVSIELKNEIRGKWTTPKEEGGLGDAFLTSLTDEMESYLKADYPLSKFRLLVGHSRTAIFSIYALSKRPDFFTGCIANSAAYFDFGSNYQKKVFETFLEKIKTIPTNKYLYFSSGQDWYGDGHEASCIKFSQYLDSIDLPENLKWKYVSKKANHFSIPGIVTADLLNDIFLPYQEFIQKCFEYLKTEPAIERIQWTKFDEIEMAVEQNEELDMHRDLTFYFSVASHYANDYDGLNKASKLDLCQQLLEDALLYYPKTCDFIDWLNEIYTEKKSGMEWVLPPGQECLTFDE